MKVQITKISVLTLIGLLSMSSLAAGHTGHEHSAGSVHVLASLEHLVAFVVLGAALATLMFVRKGSALLLANLALGTYLGLQAWTHTTQGGVLFGAEVFAAGGILALGAWRGMALWMENIKAKRYQNIH